jgi:hypothetical protein
VEIDDAYLGGERAGHINGGPKAANKTAFIAAVQTSSDGRPLYMRLTPVADFTIEDVKQRAGRYLAPGGHGVSDGTAAFAHVRQAGATHERHVTGGERQGVKTPQLHWVNTPAGQPQDQHGGHLPFV